MDTSTIPSCSVVVLTDAHRVAYSVIALCKIIRKKLGDALDLEFKTAKQAEIKDQKSVILLTSSGTCYECVPSVLRYICRVYLPKLYEAEDTSRNAEKATTIDAFLSDSFGSVPAGMSNATAFDNLNSDCLRLNTFLSMRSFLVGQNLSLADIYMWGELKGNLVFQRLIKTSKAQNDYPNLVRWYSMVDTQQFAVDAVTDLLAQRQVANKSKKDQGNLDINLPDTNADSVVITRFPPEPSGYMHIGHAKALLLNEYFARKYKNGKLILRFDDTNPSKEDCEFEQTITEDVAMLGVVPDIRSHTSDYFDVILSTMDKMIIENNAYVDETDVDTMRRQRMNGEASASRNISVAESLRRWDEMKKGTEFGLKCCVRARLSVDDANKALRDPVMFRCNLTPHHHTGTKYKVYPTYDFACPIVDAIEGVTHALRTSEYRDRNAQYSWIQAKLGLRKVHVIEYSRLNFVYTLLSKRKLQFFVEQKIVSGWNDPRFPTVRGMLRRGLTVDALRTYVLMQGASQRDMLLEWDKLWAINRRAIDLAAPRHVAISKPYVLLTFVPGSGVPTSVVENRNVLKHKKNPALGNKQTSYSSKILIEAKDAKDLSESEEFTLMDWGNAKVISIVRDPNDSSIILKIEASLYLEGDVKTTTHKFTWLAEESNVDVELRDYDYLITKKKLEEGDEIKDFITPCSEFVTAAIADKNVKSLRRGEIIQFERRGFFICDRAFDSKNKTVPVFIAIPDSKAASVAPKHTIFDANSMSNASTADKRKERRLSDTTKVKISSTNISSSPVVPAVSALASGTTAVAGAKVRRRVSFCDDAVAQMSTEMRESVGVSYSSGHVDEVRDLTVKIDLTTLNLDIDGVSSTLKHGSKPKLRSPPPPNGQSI